MSGIAPKGHLAMSGHTFGCSSPWVGGTGIYLVEARDAAQHSTKTRQHPTSSTTKTHPPQNVHAATVETFDLGRFSSHL